MSNRIVDLNGKPTPEQPKQNVRDLIESARLLYDGAEKREAFHKLCDVLHLLSDGVARSFHDISALKERITPK